MSHVQNSSRVPFEFRGLQIRELTPEDLQWGSVAEIEVPPGSTHDTTRSLKSDKLYICVEGTVAFQVENNNLKLEPMDVLLIHKLCWFNYHNNTEKPARLVLIHTPPFNLANEEFRV